MHPGHHTGGGRHLPWTGRDSGPEASPARSRTKADDGRRPGREGGQGLARPRKDGRLRNPRWIASDVRWVRFFSLIKNGQHFGRRHQEGRPLPSSVGRNENGILLRRAAGESAQHGRASRPGARKGLCPFWVVRDRASCLCPGFTSTAAVVSGDLRRASRV